MSKSQVLLSTQEYAEKAGISAATVSKWLRSGKLKGRKDGSKWMISSDQLPSQQKTEISSPPKVKTAVTAEPVRTEAPHTLHSQHSYTVEEFSAMTYLTIFGVQQWLKDGRLKGAKDESGYWRVDSENLQDPNVLRLIRK